MLTVPVPLNSDALINESCDDEGFESGPETVADQGPEAGPLAEQDPQGFSGSFVATAIERLALRMARA